MPKVSLFFLICIFTSANGCQQELTQPPSLVQEVPRRAAVKLVVLIVDDPPLAAGIKLLRGEWAERSGGQIDLQEWTNDQLLAATELAADLVIYPSRYVGTLVDREWLRPVRKSVLQSAEMAMDDLFPLVRNTTIRYGNQVYGLSLGEPPLMLAGLLDSTLKGENSTWQQIDFRLATENTALKQPRAAELLARGIAYTPIRSRSTSWFEVESMQPQIAGPPFVRALQQMLENEKSPVEQSHRGLALSWPSAHWPANPQSNSQQSVEFVPLPRARQVYNPLREIWEDNDTQQPLTFLGFSGRTVSVSRSTRNSASAFKLLAWMISEGMATQLSSRSEATVWCRSSQAAQANRWLSRSGASNETAAAVTRLLSSEHAYLLPRIPGIDDYLQVLEDAILRATLDNFPAEKVLSKVADQWNALTDRYGRDRQRVAYRQHLEMNEK